MPTTVTARSAKARSLSLHVTIRHGWQGPNYLRQYLLPRVSAHRKLGWGGSDWHIPTLVFYPEAPEWEVTGRSGWSGWVCCWNYYFAGVCPRTLIFYVPWLQIDLNDLSLALSYPQVFLFLVCNCIRAVHHSRDRLDLSVPRMATSHLATSSCLYGTFGLHLSLQCVWWVLELYVPHGCFWC